jgi:hypothetical protein
MEGNRKRVLAGLGIFFILVLATNMVKADSYTIDGNSVYVNDSNVYIRAYPHTITHSQWVYFNLTSKAYTGDIDVVWGFDTDIAKPTMAYYHNPRWVNQTQKYVCGHEFNYTLSPNYFWCYRNLTDNQTNQTYTHIIFEHSFDTGNIPTKTAYWNETVFVEWSEISGLFQSTDYDYGGMNKWWYKKNFPVTAGNSYLVKVWVNMPLVSQSGKYWFAVKPSSETISQAISSGHFYYLDPWWNSSYPYRSPIYSNTTNNTIPFCINDSAGVNGQYIWTLNSTEQLYLYSTGTGATGDLAVGNETDEKNWENVSTLLGNNPTSIYPSHIQGWWHFDDGTNASDSSPNNNDGTNNGAVSVTGKIGKGLDFEKDDSDYVSVGDIYSSEITVLGLFRFESDTGANQRLVSKDDDGANREYTLFWWRNNNDFSFITWTDGGDGTCIADSVGGLFSVGQWYCIGATYNGTHAWTYVDGIQYNDGSNHCDGAISNLGANLEFGRRQDGAEYFDGVMDEVVVFNRALSPEEINSTCRNAFDNLTSLGSEESNVSIAITTESPTNTTYYTTTIDFNVTLNNAGEWCGYSLDGASNITMSNDSATHFYYTDTNVSNGTHNVIFNCNDSNGDWASPQQVYFTVIEQFPIYITVNSPASGYEWLYLDSIPESKNFTINATVSQDTGWTIITWNGVNYTYQTTTALPRNFTLNEGINTWQIWANESSGNTTQTKQYTVVAQKPANPMANESFYFAYNEVLDLGSAGQFDSYEFGQVHLLWNGTKMILAYIGTNSTVAKYGQAYVDNTTNMSNFTKDSLNPLLNPIYGTYDKIGFNSVFHGKNGKDYMVFTSTNVSTDNSIWLAETNTSNTWTEMGMILGNESAWEGTLLAQPTVVNIPDYCDISNGYFGGDEPDYLMFYGASNSYYIGRAWATDESITNFWTKDLNNPVIDGTETTNPRLHTYVYLIDCHGNMVMYFNSLVGDYKIYRAFSNDWGANWTGEELVIDNSPIEIERLSIYREYINENETVFWYPSTSKSLAQYDNVSIYKTTVSLQNVAPTINNVSYTPSADPIDGTIRTLIMNFTATDSNANLWDSTANITMTKGSFTYSNSSCNMTVLGNTVKRYDCNIDLNYYDESGTWNINFSVCDTDGLCAENTTETFTYNTLKAFTVNSSAINFGNFTLSTPEKLSALQLNNTGNVNVSALNVTGYDLQGESNSSVYLLCSDNVFSVRQTGFSYINLTNATQVTAPSSYLYVYPSQYSVLEFRIVPTNIPSDTISQTYSGTWSVDI